MQTADVAIIGGGIVGLATAYRLIERFPGQRVMVLEKESQVAAHQTGNNSGVLHSGIYYKPGSLRATNCRAGKLAMEEFCEQNEIPFDLCGKVIVATNENEAARLNGIVERGQQNGVKCEIIDQARLNQIEPHSAGIKAIHVPEAGIVDYRQVCERFAELLKVADGDVMLNAKVTAIRQTTDNVIISSSGGDVTATYAVNCTGLYSDRITRLGGTQPESQIVPFRGEYFELIPAAEHLCKGLIYPVPDPEFPFLGVHFTRMIHGGVECGPNAVLAFAREGYRKTDINLKDLFESLTYPGFLRLAAGHWRMGMSEMWRSFSKKAFVKALQKLMPEIRSEHLVAAPSGVRAQALARDGSLVKDFQFVDNGRIINVCNAPSPAATASLNVGKLVVDRLAQQIG
jgi:L-2-hydroxyglutarate oxidase